VLKLQLVTVTNLLLPNSAQASSWQATSQLAMWTYWVADEVKTVVVLVHMVVDAHAVKLHARALEDAHAVIRVGR